jgi:hypothetical protein
VIPSKPPAANLKLSRFSMSKLLNATMFLKVMIILRLLWKVVGCRNECIRINSSHDINQALLSSVIVLRICNFEIDGSSLSFSLKEVIVKQVTMTLKYKL